LILCEHGPQTVPALFSGALRLWAPRTGAELRAMLAELDRARAGGAWVAGWMGYEAGLALEPRLEPLLPEAAAQPLAVFGTYDGPQNAGPLLARASAEAADARLTAPAPMISRSDYGAAFSAVQSYIAAGDIYQANLTFPMRAELTSGTALGLYGALRGGQPVGWGGFAEMGQGPALISRSPEMFVAVDGAGRISARPMKGTAPRDPDPVRDAELAETLRLSTKNRAENLMIVDLLRNDIARVSRVGSVRVPQLFEIETYATVHQMVSQIEGHLRGAAGLDPLLRALFPCGSVTGAPKIRAMQLIHQVEAGPRGAYCGCMGWMAPDGRAAFNVMIRTLSLFEGGRIVMNVGGGIVHDSREDEEWEEALWKARFATPRAPTPA
jgi:para-aminobenzoate synthetase component 1